MYSIILFRFNYQLECPGLYDIRLCTFVTDAFVFSHADDYKSRTKNDFDGKQIGYAVCRQHILSAPTNNTNLSRGHVTKVC